MWYLQATPDQLAPATLCFTQMNMGSSLSKLPDCTALVSAADNGAQVVWAVPKHPMMRASHTTTNGGIRPQNTLQIHYIYRKKVFHLAQTQTSISKQKRECKTSNCHCVCFENTSCHFVNGEIIYTCIPSYNKTYRVHICLPQHTCIHMYMYIYK